MTNNRYLKSWIDGSREQLDGLRREACASSELLKLNEEKLPNCDIGPFIRD
jgi:GTP-dependent phosphoenolpyruvate carboxykinase